MYTYSKNYTHQSRQSRLPAPKKPRQRLSFGKIVAILVCIIVIFTLTKGVFANSKKSDDKKEVVAAEQQLPPKRKVDTSNLAASISQVTAQYPYNTSVSVIDLNSGTAIQSGDSAPFIAASTTKILTALAYFTNVENNQASLNDKLGGQTAQKQLELAINKSDNSAWKLLNEDLGKESLASYATHQGLTSYDPVDNKISSSDIAKLMGKLYKRELINEEHTKLLLSWMQNTSEERYIPADVPADVTVYHKAGYLADRVHDVAIIDNGSAPFVLVIYSKSYSGEYNHTVGEKLYKQVTQRVLTTFQ